MLFISLGIFTVAICVAANHVREGCCEETLNKYDMMYSRDWAGVCHIDRSWSGGKRLLQTTRDTPRRRATGGYIITETFEITE